MVKVPFANLFESIEPIYGEIIEKLETLIKSTNFIGGAEVDNFENEFAQWTKTKFAIGTANGTDAIIIALKALGIGPGDVVLVPAMTFIATAEAVTIVGATVDFVDVENDFYTMDPECLVKYLEGPNGPKVKAVIPVHLYGQMANMPRVAEIASRYNIKVIEDSAQAHGAKICGQQPGHYGDIATYSFYPGKNLGAFGDAGAITTDDENLYKTCKMLVNHGRWNAKYQHEIEGFNMRLDTIQAAILRIKLRQIDQWTKARKEKADLYLEKLKEKRGVVPPKVRDGAEHVWHIFPVLLEARDEMMKKLKNEGIESGIHYPIPLHLQPAYMYKGYKTGDFPVSEMIAKCQLSLPIWPEINETAIDLVVRCIIE